MMTFRSSYESESGARTTYVANSLLRLCTALKPDHGCATAIAHVIREEAKRRDDAGVKEFTHFLSSQRRPTPSVCMGQSSLRP